MSDNHPELDENDRPGYAPQAFYPAALGEQSWIDALDGYVLPALIGNAIGGTALVAALNHAQATSGEG